MQRKRTVNILVCHYLNDGQEAKARNYIYYKYESLTPAQAAYESKENSLFRKAAFAKNMCQLTPIKYWEVGMD